MINRQSTISFSHFFFYIFLVLILNLFAVLSVLIENIVYNNLIRIRIKCRYNSIKMIRPNQL